MSPGLIFELVVGLGFDHEEATENHRHLNTTPQQWKKTQNYMNYAVFLQYYIGTY
jgi:hypothetical protein